MNQQDRPWCRCE